MSTLDDSISLARGVLKKFGEMNPFLLVEGTTNRTAISLEADLPLTAEELTKELYAIGKNFAKEKSIGNLLSVFHVSTATLIGLTSHVEKQDILVIIQLRVETMQQEATAFTIVRDADKNFSALAPLEEISRQAYDPQLLAFVQGYFSAQKELS